MFRLLGQIVKSLLSKQNNNAQANVTENIHQTAESDLKILIHFQTIVLDAIQLIPYKLKAFP